MKVDKIPMCSSKIIFCSLTYCYVFKQLQFSEVLVKWRQFFNYLAAQQGKSEMMVLEQKLELEQLKVCLALRKSNAGSCMHIHN